MDRPKFIPPEVKVGQTVLWYPDPGLPESAGTAALVSQVSGQVISCNLIVPGSATLLPRNGVPHADDSFERINAVQEGCWRMRGADVLVTKDDIALLTKQMAAQAEELVKLRANFMSVRGTLANLSKKNKAVDTPVEEVLQATGPVEMGKYA